MAMLFLSTSAVAGCALPDNGGINETRQASAASMAVAPASVTDEASAQSSDGASPESKGVQASASPLPFKGRLVSGETADLPPSVAASLSPDAPIIFTYREDLTHDEYHLPLWFSAIDPATLVGAPLGDFGVTASAALTIERGDDILGQYTAKAHVSKPYSLYKQPTHRDVEQAARAAVRAKIDQQLAEDNARLRQAAVEASSTTGK